MATSKGHMHQTRKNLKYTKPQYTKTLEELLMKPMVQRTNTLFTFFTKIINHKRKIATDPTGKSPVTSNRRNKYQFVLYYYDSNCTLIRPIKLRADSEFIRLFTDPHEHLLTRGLKPSYTKLENEASPAFQRELKAKNIDLQIPYPGIHYRNVTERAISTFKHHFIAGLCSTIPDFPM